MAALRRSTSLAAAVAFTALLLVGAPGPAGAQDVTTTVPGAEVTTTVAGTETTGAETTIAGTEEEADDGTTLLEAGEPASQSLASENRRIRAIIGALVVVAVALLLLTVRYIRVTKPVPPTAAVDPVAPAVVAAGAGAGGPVDEPAPTTRRGRRSRRAVAGADHAAADADWEPRGTGEHEVVEVPAAAGAVRPGVDARRRALGLTVDS